MRAHPVLAALLVGPLISISVVVPARAAEPSVPTRPAVLSAVKAAADYYRPTFPVTSLTPRNGWSWSTYAQGVRALYGVRGDQRYRDEGIAWGRASSWGLSRERNPDNIKAGQVYLGWHDVDAAADLTAMDARMKADLTGLPSAQYDWADALFMGLPDWALWARRTGDPAYAARMDDFYTWMRDSGASGARCGSHQPTQPGLYDANARLWYRDCSYVGTLDASGKHIFWGRGNGWVVAAMADVIASLPAGDPRAAKYADMLRLMSARLVTLQGTDGMWRASLEDPALFPKPETSATALITYAMAAGVRLGVLDAATYLPVIARAWKGLSTIALQPSGFLSFCQAAGIAPASPYAAAAPRTAASSASSGTVNTDSPPFCVGAFILAGTEIAALTPDLAPGRPVFATAQQSGNEVGRLTDGDVTTRWSASGFPQSATVDLRSATRIGATMVTPYLDRAYRYRIEASNDAATWVVLVDRTQTPSAGSQLDSFSPVSYRFVRLVVTGVVGNTTSWVSIQAFGIYPATTDQLVAMDSFTRTVSGGLGSANPGGPWRLVGNAAASAVSGSTAQLTPAPGSAVAGYLDSAVATGVDIRVTTGLSKVPSGGSAYVALVVRHNGTNDYRLKLKRPGTGSATVSLIKAVGGTDTVLASKSLPTTLGATDPARLRLEVVATDGGTALRAKAWELGGAEPDGWLLTAVDATTALQGAGAIGLWTALAGSATNPPVTVLLDDLEATLSG